MYQRILVPYDGSETAQKGLATALQLASVSGGRLRLVHVVEELAYLTGYDSLGGNSGDLIKVMRETGDKILDQGLVIARSAGVQADHVLYGDFGHRLAEMIAEAANGWNADLIVVGTHGRRGVGRLLLGSGAEQIIRLAPVPVLVVPAAQQPKPAKA